MREETDVNGGVVRCPDKEYEFIPVKGILPLCQTRFSSSPVVDCEFALSAQDKKAFSEYSIHKSASGISWFAITTLLSKTIAT
jgi:hypothetical protein